MIRKDILFLDRRVHAPDAIKVSVVPVSTIPAVGARTDVLADPKVILWSMPTNSLDGEVAVIGLFCV